MILMWPQQCASGMSNILRKFPANISSALLKLHKNRLSDSFSQGLTNKVDSQLAARIRQCTEGSYNALQDTSLQTLNFAQSLERRIVASGVDKLSPLVLHSIYRAAFWLSHLAAATREDRFLVGRSICDRVLTALSLRWKVAGNCKSPMFIDACH